MILDKFQNKYRIPSARLQNWDYGSAGAYFITTNTKYGEYYFGDIMDAKMQLSHIGVIADILWYEIENHFKNVKLGEFVIMPNHVHGILILNGNDNDNRNRNRNRCICRDDACIVSTNKNTNTKPYSQSNTDNENKNEQMAKISPKSGSVARIIGSYKSAVSKHAHRFGFDFSWQERFYDHIIRDDKSFNRITNYIINNPRNWENDKFYKITPK